MSPCAVKSQRASGGETCSTRAMIRQRGYGPLDVRRAGDNRRPRLWLAIIKGCQ
jgi:hypothetical protein